jgi:hypothetical protein
MMSSVITGGTRYIVRRRVHRRKLLHHEEVGCSSAPKLVAGGIGVGNITSG